MIGAGTRQPFARHLMSVTNVLGFCTTTFSLFHICSGFGILFLMFGCAFPTRSYIHASEASRVWVAPRVVNVKTITH